MAGNPIKWKVAAWIIIHTPISVFVLLLLVLSLIYPVLAGYFVGLSEEHNWLSSFIEVTIAVNSSMLVTDVREWFKKKFRMYNQNFGSIVASRISVKRNDMTLARLGKKMKQFEGRFEIRLQSIVQWFGRFCFLAIVGACILLLTDCPKDCPKIGYQAIPLLLWPFILFYACLFGNLLWALDGSRQCCRETIREKNAGISPEGQISELEASIPKPESEE